MHGSAQGLGLEHLDASDLDHLKDAVADLRDDDSSLTLETGGDLFFAFEEAPTGLGEVAGIVVAMVAARGSRVRR